MRREWVGEGPTSFANCSSYCNIVTWSFAPDSVLLGISYLVGESQVKMQTDFTVPLASAVRSTTFVNESVQAQRTRSGA